MVWNGEGRGRIAKAPPPEAFQLTLMYCYSFKSTHEHISRFVNANSYPRCRYNIGVPSTVCHFHVLNAIFLLRRLAENMAEYDEFKNSS